MALAGINLSVAPPALVRSPAILSSARFSAPCSARCLRPVFTESKSHQPHENALPHPPVRRDVYSREPPARALSQPVLALVHRRSSASTCSSLRSPTFVRWKSSSRNSVWAALAVKRESRRLLLRKMKRAVGFLGLWLALSLAANAAEPWTLERALDYALAHNPDARIAQQRIAVAQAGLEQANSTFWPRLQVQSGYTRTDNPMMAFGSILNQRSYSSSLNFNDVPGVDDLNAQGMSRSRFTPADEMSRAGKPPRRPPRPRSRRAPPSATRWASRCRARFTPCSRRGSSF